MSDAKLTAGWLIVLALGLFGCAALRSAGVPRTYVRDLLHVGVGVWPLGWNLWHTPAVPIAIAVAGVALVAFVPVLARWSPRAARVRDSVAGDEERWAGLVLYAASVAGLTWAGMRGPRFAAAAALLALALGDGIGGAVGRRFGRHRFAVPFAKPKTLEGTLAVAIFAAIGIAVAAEWFGSDPSWSRVIGGGAAAAAAEGIAPRTMDNLLVPAAVWLVVSAS